jgi:hypothetical protein
LSLVFAGSGSAQNASPTETQPATPITLTQQDVLEKIATQLSDKGPSATISTVQLLRDFKDADVKFDLNDLMEILRDHRHEGWVLAAYPDPKTSDPLIGAGFTLNLPVRKHPQQDPLNPHPFLEPSSAELWQAAGLDADRLQRILDQYKGRMAAWNKKKFRKKIKTLPPDITADEATLLLRISAVQAIYNAKAYCRYFDQLTPSQQMALSQLVYQMGVNLEEFTQFLALINADSIANDPSAETPPKVSATDQQFWNSVQKSLMQSQWARLYRVRAVAVIAMLDPTYADSPGAAENRISAALHPPRAHRRRSHSAEVYEVASTSTSKHGRPSHRKSHAHSRRTT